MMRPADPVFRMWVEGEAPRLKAWAHDILFLQKGSIVPAIIVHTVKGHIAYFPLEFANLRDKDHAARFHYMVADRPEVRDAIFVSEVWTITTDRREDIPGSLEHVPGRAEGVMFSVRRKDMQLMLLLL